MNVRGRVRVNSLTGLLLFALLDAASAAAGAQSHESIRDTVRAFVLQQHSNRQARVTVDIGQIDPRLQLSACGGPLQAFLPPGGRLIGGTSIGVRCPSVNAWTVYVPARIKVYAPVIVTARPVPRGTVLRAEDIRAETRDLGAIPGVAYTEAAQVLGRQAAMPLGPGMVLSPAMVRPARLIRRGDRITILANSGGVEVRVAGEALSDGYQGEPVQVRNLLTKKVIQGTTAQAGLVQVAL